MSSQLIFFMVPEDWASMLNFFQKQSVQLIEFKSRTPDIDLVNDVPWENGRPPFKVGLVHPDSKTNLLRCDKGRFDWYELDTERSSVIEFNTGCFYGGDLKKLHQARFYTVNDYYARRGEHVTKDEQFKKWVKSFYGKFRRAFLHKYGVTNFVSYTENAIQWIEANNAVLDGGAISLSIPSN